MVRGCTSAGPLHEYDICCWSTFSEVLQRAVVGSSASKGEEEEGGCSLRNRRFRMKDMTNCGGDYSDSTCDTAAYGGVVKATNMSLYRWLPSSETGDSALESTANVEPVLCWGDGFVWIWIWTKLMQWKLKWLECKSGAYNPQLVDPMTCIPFADINTRAIFVQFTLFNVNYDLFVRSEYRRAVRRRGLKPDGCLMQRDSPDAAFVTFLNFILWS